MFEYTKTAIDVIVKDLRRIFFIFNSFLQLLYIGYLIYALSVGTGNTVANICLLTLSLAYFLFFVLTYNRKARGLKRLAKRTYSLAKIGVNTFTIGVAVYGIYATAGDVKPTAVVLLVLMVIGWLISILLQVAIYFIESRAHLLVEAFQADKDAVMKPITTVTNTFKRLTGKEVDETEKPKSRLRRFLDRKVENKKQEEKETVHK